MNVFYCAVISIPHRTLLAETNNTEDYFGNLVSPILNRIISNKCPLDSLEIANEKFANFVMHKNLIILLCISNDDINSEKYKTFFVRFKDILINEFSSIKESHPKNISPLCLQSRLNRQLEKFMKEYESEIYKNKSGLKEMNKDLFVIKENMNVMINKVLNKQQDLNELLIKCEKIKFEATDLKNNAQKLEVQTRCMKPWMWVVLIVGIILLIAYICFCITRCGNLFKAIC